MVELLKNFYQENFPTLATSSLSRDLQRELIKDLRMQGTQEGNARTAAGSSSFYIWPRLAIASQSPSARPMAGYQENLKTNSPFSVVTSISLTFSILQSLE